MLYYTYYKKSFGAKAKKSIAISPLFTIQIDELDKLELSFYK